MYRDQLSADGDYSSSRGSLRRDTSPKHGGSGESPCFLCVMVITALLGGSGVILGDPTTNLETLLAMTRIRLLHTLACLVLLVEGAHASTVVGGQITRTTWTSGEPWEVTSPCTLATGNTLTIEAGVTVLMHPGTGMKVLGALHTRGTAVDSVRFFPVGTGDWRGIDISGTDSSSFAYTRLSGCRFNGTGGALRVSNLGTRVYLANCVIRDNVADIGGGLHVYSSAHAVLQSCTISRNVARGNGGGMEVTSASTELLNCTLSVNTANWGGGIDIVNSEVKMDDCTITRNVASEGAGGVWIFTTPLSGKTSYVTFLRCTIEGNTANEGAGVYVSDRTEAILDSCILTTNSAANAGGGLFVSRSNVTLRRCTLNYNEAYFGGAISASAGAGVITKRCLLTSNQASIGGMAYGEGASILTLDGCTSVSNVAQSDGGAVYLMSGSSAIIRSSILWDNSPHEVYIHPTNPGILEFSYSCVGPGTVVAGPGNIASDPLFANPLFGDYSLSQGSPCIDTGDPAAPTDQDGSRTDMDTIPYTHPAPELPPPTDMAISAAPNPFGATALVKFSLPTTDLVHVVLYDVRGVRVRSLINRKMTAGRYTVTWSGHDGTGRQCASGVYLLRLTTGSRSTTTRVTLVR
jgi:hypothetical protein